LNADHVPGKRANRREPERVRQPLTDRPGHQVAGAAGTVRVHENPAPGSSTGSMRWQLAQGFAHYGDVSAAVFDPTLPFLSITASGSPVRSGPWSGNVHNWWTRSHA
jgi:hypothetical protein